MKKYILILVAVLGLSGCTSRPMKDPGVALVENEENYKNYSRVFMNQETKDVVYELYELSNQYRDRNNTFISTLRNLNEGYLENQRSLEIYRSGLDEELFDQIVQLLDESIGQGVKDYYENMEKGQAPALFNQVLIGSDEDDVFLILDPFDIKDNKIKQVYRQVFTGKYKVLTALGNDDYSYLEVEKNNYGFRESSYSNLIYGLIFQDYQVEKANIFFNIYAGAQIEKEDLEVFNRLLDYLKIEDRQKLLEDFENISSGQIGKEAYDLGGYRIRLINNTNNSMGRRYNDENFQAYMSIEKI